MSFRDRAGALALSLLLAGCGAGGDDAPNGNTAAAAGAENAAEAGNASAAPQLAGCPFRRTREWVGSVEGGHVRINGYVDVQMVGFRPALTERPGAPAGTIALDLAFAPAPNEPISDHARFERLGAPAYRRAEIWCGGERIELIDMILVQ